MNEAGAGRHPGFRFAAVAAVFVLLLLGRVVQQRHAQPNPQEMILTLAEPGAVRSDPLITAGRPGEGDFLSVHVEGNQTVRFAYDSWGQPALVSAPVRLGTDGTVRLRLTLPIFSHVRGSLAPPSTQVRIEANGVEVLNVPGHSYLRDPGQIHFGRNPLGGTACGPALRGRLATPDGTVLAGTPPGAWPGTAQVVRWLGDWMRRTPAEPLLLLALSGLGVWAADRLRRVPFAAIAWRHRWFTGSAALASLAFAWVVTLGSFRFDYAEPFGSFYDYQAASLLEGRLDVPEVAIGGEAFEARGKLYGYFGPTPALLRMPFLVAGVGFGKLSRAFMLGYFAASLAAAYLILRDATARLGGRTAAPGGAPVPAPWATVLLVGGAGLGSTLFFLGSRGLIFHEAILGGVAFALGSTWCALRHLADDRRGWWLGALVLGVLSVHTRPPTGLFALTLLGAVALLLAGRAWRRTDHRELARHGLLAALCAAGFLSLNGLAWLKFRTFDAAPLRLSRPYADPGRLAHIDGRSFHAVNIPYNTYTYMVRPNFRLEPRFPWIYLGSPQPGRSFPAAKIDLADHTLALPYAMPSLFFLATLGGLAAAAARPELRAPIALLWAAALPMTLALFAAVATAQRYTGDFCPLLIAAAACSLAALESAPRPVRAVGRGLAAVATILAMAVTVALTLHYQGDYLWGVPAEVQQNYQQLRHRVDALFGVRPPS